MELNQTAVDAVKSFIREHFPRTIRENMHDEEDRIGLPKPYIVPCADGMFQDLYYWDTYFACVGLGTFDDSIMRHCAEDFAALVERFGFIPNGSRTFYLNRSQPPYFTLLVDLVWQREQDRDWLAKLWPALEAEYDYWMRRRSSPTGLNRYGNHATNDEKLEFYKWCCGERLGMKHTDEREQLEQSAHTLAEAESGWDFNPRFDCRCEDFNPVDLNSLLYRFECLMAQWARVLGRDDAGQWLKHAEARQSRMRHYLWNEERGAFMDYDYRRREFSPVLSAASYMPLWLGVANASEAKRSVEALAVLDCAGGVVGCEPGERERVYQWDWPNGWAPQQYPAWQGLIAAGHEAKARELATRYVAMISRCFEQSGALWEKYNVVEASIKVGDEYEMPPMLGWTAGIFMEALRMLGMDE